MTLLVECLPDETTAAVLGIPRRGITHYSGKDELCKALSRGRGLVAMLDEDPLSPQPSYLRRLGSSDALEGIKVLADQERAHSVILVCPRLEDWLEDTTKRAQLTLADAGFSAKDAYSLHGEINQRLGSLEKLLRLLLERKSTRLLRLKNALLGQTS